MTKLICARSHLRESSSSDDEDPHSFTLFPRLPVELRLAIWRSTFPPPRRVFLDGVRRSPIALSINHESRQLALFYYTNCDRKSTPDRPQPRYVDFSADTLPASQVVFFGTNRIQNLMLDHSDSSVLETKVFSSLHKMLCELPRLRQVLVMVHYRDAYQTFKQTELQMERKLESINPILVERIRRLKESKELRGETVEWNIPNIAMESCKPCFRRRGGRHYRNLWCKSQIS